MGELKAAVRKLQDAAAAVEAEAAAETSMIEEEANRLRLKSEHAQLVLSAIEEAEREEERLAGLRGAKQPLVVQLGELFKGKNIKPAELLRSYDLNNDGMLSKAEFAGAVKKLGLQVEPGESDKVFDELDEDGSGYIELTELKQVLRKLQDAMNEATAELRAVEKSAAALRAKSAQSEKQLLAMEEADAAAAAAREAAAREARESQAAEQAKRHSQAAARQAAQKAKSEAERQAFEAKVARKRSVAPVRPKRSALASLRESFSKKNQQLRDSFKKRTVLTDLTASFKKTLGAGGAALRDSFSKKREKKGMPPTSVPQERDSRRLLDAPGTCVLATAGACGGSVLVAAGTFPPPPSTAAGGMFTYVGEKRTVLRARVDRASTKVGDIEPEAIVTVLEFGHLDDGTRRARVDDGETIGWMTAEKEGKVFLVPCEADTTGHASAHYPPIAAQGGGSAASVFAAAGVAPSPPKERKASRAVVSLEGRMVDA